MSTASLGAAPRVPANTVIVAGAVMVLLSLVWSSTRGAFAIGMADLGSVLQAWLQGGEVQSPAELVLLHIRLPRLVLGLVAGAGLGFAGALMQGLFRNPLADPGLIGVSAGAALAAAGAIVVGAAWFPLAAKWLGSWYLITSAFAGALLVTVCIYLLAQSERGTRVGMMLLAGIAVNALAGAALGYLSFVATDEQLRSLQFWMMGSLGGARWGAVGLVATLVVLGVLVGMRLARPLDAMALGEAQAVMLGVDVEQLKRRAVLLCALLVGAITACTGMIGFVGLVAPHCVRMLAGPGHRVTLLGSALLGAVLVLLADSVARTWVQPAELPLGVLTSFVGVPPFLALLYQMRGRV
ncbi:FecCD family ABC transporter permease [Rhodoferax aquaticus]|uniref:Iron ABC transporter permease n=1 Tax=Rhodoferax aquaticus TaxID=2527691 RepID=A0A515ENF7_9BURK|nr:iron ABC transporter permease [Rhodoferax aquaticus]QDL54199.1 iron ABC transporter permease [Rhodoferax aquaticus]